jgi:hypothetical protein
LTGDLKPGGVAALSGFAVFGFRRMRQLRCACDYYT